jgi:phospholipid transport system substrate-binding protein
VKQRMMHLVAAAVSLALTFGALGSAFAGMATDAVKTKQEALFGLLQQGGTDTKKIDALVDDMFDYTAFAQGSLGNEWAPRTDAEKAQFTDLLTQLVRRAYRRNLKKIAGYDVQYLGEDPAQGGVLVKSKSISKTDARADPVEINFQVQDKGGGKWKVVDLVAEGQSQVESFRGQFGSIIKKSGFAAAIQKMKDRLAKDD